jgi:hypothetical protein
MNQAKQQKADKLAKAVRDLAKTWASSIPEFAALKAALADYESAPSAVDPRVSEELLAAAEELHHQAYIQLVETFCRNPFHMQALSDAYERYTNAKRAKP